MFRRITRGVQSTQWILLYNLFMEMKQIPTWISKYYIFAGIYGVLVLFPHYFFEIQLGIDQPPPITHPEFYYGFVGVALVFQLIFFVISRDPVRYRPLMPVCVLEKLSFSIAVYTLFFQGRIPSLLMLPASIDLLFGVGFLISYQKTPK